MANFYEEKIQEIKELIKQNKKLALQSLKEELKMIYIPEKYEIQFQELMNKLKLDIAKKTFPKSLTKAKIIEFLNSQDNIKEAIAIDALKDQNLRIMTKELKQRMETSSNKNLGKAFIYEYLAFQEIDIDLNIDGIKINPKFNKTFFDDKEVIKAFKKINVFIEQNIQFQKLIQEQLKLYILLIFPHKIIDGNKVAKNIFNIVQFMLGQKKTLSNEEKKIYKNLKG